MKNSVIFVMIYNIIFSLLLLALGIPWAETMMICIVNCFIFDCIVPEIKKREDKKDE